jgi:formylglycine-generating enzyme required for sulfatase activity
MTKEVALGLALVVATAAQQAATPNTGKRYALLVGNTAYKLLPALPAALAETNALQAALEQAGFEVTRKDNTGKAQFIPELVKFLDQIQPNDVCFFYFSGYTVQSAESDDNYLLPVDFNPNDDNPIDSRSVALGVIQQRMDRRNETALKIFMLESPRKLDVAIRGATAGVRVPSLEDSHESLFAFAALPGQTVSARPPGSMSLFTQQVIANIGKPGSRLRDVFENAKDEVARATERRQIPLVEDNVVEGFYFHEPKAPEPPPPPVTLTIVEPKRDARPPGAQARNLLGDHEDYVWIPNGQFQMGCVPGDNRCNTNENPQHEVRISKGYWMGRNEVQVRSYQDYLEAQSKKLKKKLSMPRPAPIETRNWSNGSYPMVEVKWEDAKEYCAWAGGRLPTEAEWEYAARAGSKDAIYPFGGTNLRGKVNFDNPKTQAEPVGKYNPNAWGLYDMAGNVWEWVSDFYSETYYREVGRLAVDPQGPSMGKEHAARGGSYNSDQNYLRISFRKSFGDGVNNLGFRCVLEDRPETSQRLDVKP